MENMTISREELTTRLSIIPIYEVLQLLADDTLRDMCAVFFPEPVEQPTEAHHTVFESASQESSMATTKKSKRPLNAFMAFRSKYHCLLACLILIQVRLLCEDVPRSSTKDCIPLPNHALAE